MYEHTCGGWHWIARFRYQGMAEAYKDKLNDWWERYFKGQTNNGARGRPHFPPLQIATEGHEGESAAMILEFVS